MFKQSVLIAATAAAAFLQPALATETQLQTARIVEPQQRAEFPLTGEESAFKYSYIEDVRTPLTAAPVMPAATACQQTCLQHWYTLLIVHHDGSD